MEAWQLPSLVLPELMLPEEDGLHILKRIRAGASTARLPVILITAKGTEYDKVVGLDGGADDYIAKPFGMMELMARIRTALRHRKEHPGFKNTRYEVEDLIIDFERRLVKMKGQEIHLTSTEYKLLLYLMENRGRVVTKAMLLDQLWDIDGNFVDENTVRVNIKRLRQKLNDDKQEYIVTVFGMGYTFGE